MDSIIEKLKVRLAEEEAKSLNNIKEWRKCGARDAELNSIGEVVAFSIVKNIIEEMEREVVEDVNKITGKL